MEPHNPMFQDIWPENNTLRLYPQQVSLQQMRGLESAGVSHAAKFIAQDAV
jgi:hypothetical protein